MFELDEKQVREHQPVFEIAEGEKIKYETEGCRNSKR